MRLCDRTAVMTALVLVLAMGIGSGIALGGSGATGDCDPPAVRVSFEITFTFDPEDPNAVANDFHLYMYQHDKPEIEVTGAEASCDAFPNVSAELDSDNDDYVPPGVGPPYHGAHIDMNGGNVTANTSVTLDLTLCMTEKNFIGIKDIEWTKDGVPIPQRVPPPQNHGWDIWRPFPGGEGGIPENQEGDGGTGNYIHVICIFNDGDEPMTLKELKVFASMTEYDPLSAIDWDNIPAVQNDEVPPEPPVVIPPQSEWCYLFETTGDYVGGHIYIKYEIGEDGPKGRSPQNGGSTIWIGDHPVDKQCGYTIVDDPCFWGGPPPCSDWPTIVGIDDIDNTVFEMTLFVPPDMVTPAAVLTAEGPVSIWRGPYDPVTGEMPTELVAMHGVGSHPMLGGPFEVSLDPSPPSVGQIWPCDSSCSYALSFFEVHYIITTSLPFPMDMLYGTALMQLQVGCDAITGWDPMGAGYFRAPYGKTYEDPRRVPIINRNGDTVAYVWHKHLLPDKEPECPTFRLTHVHALNGQTVSVSVTHDNNILDMGGFDFLIGYDQSALRFLEAEKGQLLEDCDWEYFTYRYGVQGNCGDACPSGLLRIIAIADLDNGPTVHPSCFGPPDFDPHELARMQFQVSADRNLIGQCAPIRFFWDDCGDNAVSSVDGNIVYMDKAIYDFTGNLLWDEEDDDGFPEDARPQGLGAPDICLEGGGPEKPEPVRFICFQNGAICIDEPPDDRGDINLNGIANEVGDAVLFSNYFIKGDVVWDPPYQEAQILATDVNDDGVVLTVADLVYLIRIITGDEEPFPPGENPKLSPERLRASVDWQTSNGELVVNWTSQVDAGAVLLAFDHHGAEFGEPVLVENASGLKMLSHNNGAQLRVLIYGMERGAAILAGSGTILRIPIATGDPGLLLGEVEAADYWGNMMTVSAARPAYVPREFALFQNIPNPFNATTRIDFNLPDTGKVTLTVYNALGQRVATLVNDRLEPGRHHIQWDARDDNGRELASGVYFYRIVTNNSQASRKMVLLK